MLELCSREFCTHLCHVCNIFVCSVHLQLKSEVGSTERCLTAMLFLCCTAWLAGMSCMLGAVSAGKTKRGGQIITGQDTFTGLAEADWYDPEEDWETVQSYLVSWSGRQHLHALDVFGVSRVVASCWTKRGHKAAALDIKLGGAAEGILGRAGFYNYLDHTMQLHLGSEQQASRHPHLRCAC